MQYSSVGGLIITPQSEDYVIIFVHIFVYLLVGFWLADLCRG